MHQVNEISEKQLFLIVAGNFYGSIIAKTNLFPLRHRDRLMHILDNQTIGFSLIELQMVGEFLPNSIFIQLFGFGVFVFHFCSDLEILHH
jgi:hypothetical protein